MWTAGRELAGKLITDGSQDAGNIFDIAELLCGDTLVPQKGTSSCIRPSKSLPVLLAIFTGQNLLIVVLASQGTWCLNNCISHSPPEWLTALRRAAAGGAAWAKATKLFHLSPCNNK